MKEHVAERAARVGMMARAVMARERGGFEAADQTLPPWVSRAIKPLDD